MSKNVFDACHTITGTNMVILDPNEFQSYDEKLPNHNGALTQYQKTSLRALLDIEEIRFIQIGNSRKTITHARYCDVFGSGKTVVLIALILASQKPMRFLPIPVPCGFCKVSCATTGHKQFITSGRLMRQTVFAVNKATFAKWINAFGSFSQLRVLQIENAQSVKHAAPIITSRNIGANHPLNVFDIILIKIGAVTTGNTVSSRTYAGDLLSLFAEWSEGLIYERLIYDDLDTAKVAITTLPVAKMTWVSSATSRSSQNSACVKDLFHEASILTIENKRESVINELKLPLVQVRYVKTDEKTLTNLEKFAIELGAAIDPRLLPQLQCGAYDEARRSLSKTAGKNKDNSIITLLEYVATIDCPTMDSEYTRMKCDVCNKNMIPRNYASHMTRLLNATECCACAICNKCEEIYKIHANDNSCLLCGAEQKLYWLNRVERKSYTYYNMGRIPAASTMGTHRLPNTTYHVTSPLGVRPHGDRHARLLKELILGGLATAEGQKTGGNNTKTAAYELTSSENLDIIHGDTYVPAPPGTPNKRIIYCANVASMKTLMGTLDEIFNIKSKTDKNDTEDAKDASTAVGGAKKDGKEDKHSSSKRFHAGTDKYLCLHGTAAQIRDTLQKFRTSNVEILVASADSCSAGFDAQFVTEIIVYDIIQSPAVFAQTLGRAQRFGRQFSLIVTVWQGRTI